MDDLKLLEKKSLDKTKTNVYIGLHKGEYFLHWHNQLELLLFITDNTAVLSANQLFQIDAGDLVVIRPCELHRNFDGRYYCIHIQNDFFKDVDCDMTSIAPFIKADSKIMKMVEQMWNAKQEGSEWSQFEVQAYAYMLMGYLFKNYKASPLPSGGEASKISRTNQINDILNYIANHCHERITTASLAQISHLNENYLCALFKSQMGMTIVEYINSFRIEKATVLLQNTNYSVTEIAMHVGFDDPGYFTRVFKKHTGVTPRAYRKNLPFDMDSHD